MDKDARSLLQRATQAARRLLENEYQQQLEGVFDILLDGTIPAKAGSHLDARQRLVRHKIIAAIAHHREQQDSDPGDAVRAYVREAAFTTLNRFVALKMLEARRLVQECLSRGEKSAGFREFTGLAPGLNVLPDLGYRLYIECLFDEIGREVRALFHRLDSAALMWPRRTALFGEAGLLAILNQPALASIWAEDETIGWVYQSFNDESERRAMREASTAPRDSRELAVRNQFFTPRYVVRFLTDNTVGRLWYDMMRGQTQLAAQCEYLVRRPREIFLGHPNLPHDSAASWVKAALAGDFSWLPECPPLNEIGEFALLIDGYALAERFGYGEAGAFGWGYLDAHIERGEPFPKDPLELWLILFAGQRGYLREWSGGAEDGNATLKAIRAAYETLRHALQHPPETLTQDELLSRPTFIAQRPLKDPREIRLLDPACGSMHFGLYAFELFVTIYQEAWNDLQLGPQLHREYGFRPKEEVRFLHETVKLIPGATTSCMLTGRQVSVKEALFVVASESDGGNGVRAGQPLVLHPETQPRAAVSNREPLVEFNYSQALSKSRFLPDDGEQFVRAAGCFTFKEDRIPSVSLDQASSTFQRNIPRLIIEHNIHGIDIDPRAAQIAALALWLRAQKEWEEHDVRPVDTRLSAAQTLFVLSRCRVKLNCFANSRLLSDIRSSQIS